MEAKDTVMEHVQVLPYWSGSTLKIDDLLEAQAEISFKAGIKEVVDNLGHSKVYFIQTEETKKVWWLTDEAKLKEWEIEHSGKNR